MLLLLLPSGIDQMTPKTDKEKAGTGLVRNEQNKEAKLTHIYGPNKEKK